MCFVLLQACGFHLRGMYQLPSAMEQTYVSASQQTSLVDELTRRLEANKINVLSEPIDTASTLKIIQESRSKRIVSVDTRGRAREYTLVYQLTFSVRNTAQAFALDEQTLNIERDFLFDSEDVLGNSRGEEELYENMQSDLVRLLMLKLQSVAGRGATK